MKLKKSGVYFKELALNSKSQAAIFLIISFIIIIAGMFYFIYQRQIVGKELEILHPESAPVKLYVENCIKSIAEDGLERIGLSGGYLNIPEAIKNDPRAYLTTFPSAGFKIPYWWHDGIESVPSLEFINKQLEYFIESELKNCLENFKPLEEKFNINELKNPIAEVQFNDEDVFVSLRYPLEISEKGSNLKFMIEKFVYTVPIRFKKVYELAKLIMERENKDNFLEIKTIDLYSMDAEIPTTDVEARCKPKFWQLSSIKDRLKNLLRVNLQYIRIKGTDYNENLYVPNPKGKNLYSDSYFNYHYIWEIDTDSEKKFKNMKVAFTYDDWPLQMYARPSQNGILRSNAQKGTDMLSFFCLQIWHFTYDVVYPVVISIIDQETKNNKIYQFNFAFKVSIDHNQPNRISTGTARFESEPYLSPDDYCNAVQNGITIFTVNNASGEDVRNVNLTFVCGRFYCDMGQSDWLSLGAASGLTKRFPYCVNGVIKGLKEGYAEAKSFIQTDVDGRSYVLALNPIKEFKNYKVVKHPISSPSIINELAPNDTALIQIKGKDIDFEGFTLYPEEAELPLTLPDGKDATYEVSIYITDNQNVIGGYIGDWKVSKEALKDANGVIFHVVEQGPASEEERALFVSGLSSYSKNVRSPELV